MIFFKVAAAMVIGGFFTKVFIKKKQIAFSTLGDEPAPG